MDRHFRLQLGNWCIENWHLYKYTKHYDAKTGGKSALWFMWDKVI